MRYADCPTVAVEVDIDASPHAIWALVTDLSVPARFSDEYQGGEWLDGATVAAPGARFRGRQRHTGTGREWETTSVITECDPGRVIAWDVVPENPAASWRFELEPLDGGRRTRLRQWARMGPGPSGLTPAIAANPDKEERIVQRRLEEWSRNMQATVDGIKQLAES